MPLPAGAGQHCALDVRCRWLPVVTRGCGITARVAAACLTCCRAQVLLKACDLGHLAAPRAVHLRWVEALEEELFRWGGPRGSGRAHTHTHTA
jgi:hypothetical protein